MTRIDPAWRCVVLVRHGETWENRSGTLQGQDPRRGRLTPEGMEQARAAGRALAGEPFEAVFCSPLERAVLTMSLMLCERPPPGPDEAPATLPLCFDDALREIHMGALHGATRTDWLAAAKAHGDIANFAPNGGESWNAVQARVGAFFDATLRQAPERCVLVVAHGGVVRGALTHLAGEPMAMTWAGLGQGPAQENGAINRVWLDADGAVRAMMANDRRHFGGEGGVWWTPERPTWQARG